MGQQEGQQPMDQRASQQPVDQQTGQQGRRQGQTRASLPLRSSKTKASTSGPDEFARQRWQGASTPTTKTNLQQCRKLSTIPREGSSGRRLFETNTSP